VFIFNVYPFLCQIKTSRSENQVVYPTPKGSNLIFFTPFRDGVNEENQEFYTDIKTDKHITFLYRDANLRFSNLLFPFILLAFL